MPIRSGRFACWAALALVIAPIEAGAVQVYSNNFDGSEVFGVGVTGALSGTTTTASVQSFPSPFAGNLLRNSTGGDFGGGGFLGAPQISTMLNLSGLPAHTSVNLDFLLAIIDSWDGIGGSPGGGNDTFTVKVNGNVVFSKVFAVQSGSSNYSPPPGVFLGSGSFGFSGFNDQAYNLGLDPGLDAIAHSASTLTIEWFAGGSGWQGGTDESWGMDNVSIGVTLVEGTVPEPATLGIMGLALAGLGFLRRKRVSA